MAVSGNGVDLGHVVAMLHDLMEGQRNLIESNRDIRATLGDHGRRLDRVEGGLDSLREAVTMYHASVLGHGVLISELDARVRRIEHHLSLPPAA